MLLPKLLAILATVCFLSAFADTDGPIKPAEIRRPSKPVEVDLKTLEAPLILIHGYVGSKAYVEARDVQFPPELKHCRKDWEFQKAWVSPMLASRLFLKQQPCLLYLLTLRYDAATKKFDEQENVNITFLGEDQFGSINPSSCLLSDSLTPVGCKLSASMDQDESSFMPMALYFEEKHRYVQGVNLFGASYDWRRTANQPEMDDYFRNLTTLIEGAVNATGKPAYLVSHSMGNFIVNYFLNKRVDEQWQKKYLNGTINVSAPWAGSMVILAQCLTGDAEALQLGASLIIENDTIKRFLRTLASSAVLIPTSLAFPTNRTLVTHQGKNYGTGNMDELMELAEIGHLRETYHEMTDNLDAQQYTPMHCVHSLFGTPKTPFALTYPQAELIDPVVTLGPGDNVVNLESLRVCKEWKEQGKLVNKVAEIEGPSHMGILHSEELFRFMEEVIGLPREA